MRQTPAGLVLSSLPRSNEDSDLSSCTPPGEPTRLLPVPGGPGGLGSTVTTFHPPMPRGRASPRARTIARSRRNRRDLFLRPFIVGRWTPVLATSRWVAHVVPVMKRWC
jgi:hypothetical protein